MEKIRWFKCKKVVHSNIIGSEPVESILYIQEKNIGFIYDDGSFEGPPDPGGRVEWHFLGVADTPPTAKE